MVKKMQDKEASRHTGRLLRGCAAALMAAAATSSFTPALAQTAPQAAMEGIRALGAPGYTGRGLLLYDAGHYIAAEDQLVRALVAGDGLTAEQRDRCLYTLALCATRTDSSRAIVLLEEYIARNPASQHLNNARLALADCHFFMHDYPAAARAYGDADIDALGRDARLLESYRQAYSLLRAGVTDRAQAIFMQLRRDAGYSLAARYYLAYIDYVEGRYDSALRDFRGLENLLPYIDRTSRPYDRDRYMPSALDASYYIAQIDFRNGEYDATARRVEKMLAGAPAEYRAELLRILGESCFKLGQNSRTRKFLNEYLSELKRRHGDSVPPSVSAQYALGCVAYHDGDYDLALEYLSPLTEEKSDIGQSASLYVGQIFSQRDRLGAAASAFDKAVRMPYDANVSETAFYNYVAAVASGANTPFSSAADIMEQFLQQYPGSKYAATVEEYLSAVYFNEKDYAKALAHIERISNPKASQRAMLQKVLYELGMQEVSNGDYSNGAIHLCRAAEMRNDPKVAAQAQLWLGQALYAQGDYKNAEKAYGSYLKKEPAGENSALALYDMGFSLYQQKKYREAAEYFGKAYRAPGISSTLKSDALARHADCLYYSGDYARARELYALAERDEGGDAAYAAMRAAAMEGLRGDNAAKASGLESMIRRYPGSKWVPTALLDLGASYAAQGEDEKALQTFRRLTNDFDGTSEARHAWLQMALIDQKKGNDRGAADSYCEIIRRWPTSEEAQTANTDLKRLMGRMGRLSEYVSFINSVPGAPKVDVAEIETIAFETAENQWVDDARAVSGLERYVEQYPDGAYLARALADLAEAYREAGDAARALDAADRLLRLRADAPQAPDVLLLKAEVLEESYPDRRAEALETYKELERRAPARVNAEVYGGMMRLSSSPADVINYARKVRAASGVSSDDLEEALFYEARALQESGKRGDAEKIYRRLAANPSTLYGARGAVALGEALMDSGRTDDAITALLQFTDEGSPHAYWLARGYIALADAYALKGERATAREYLNALKSNYPASDDDIRDIIKERLKKLK